jgi:ketosteroid isomerase-like protein
MTPEQQKQKAIQLLKEFDNPDAARISALLSDNFEYELMMHMPGMQTLFNRGEAMKNFTVMLKAMAPNGFNLKIGTAISEGPHVAVQAEGDTTAANGRRYHNRYQFYFRFEGDKIAQVREYCDTNHVREVFMV